MAKRKVYSADIRVWATIYVIADSEREARRLMNDAKGDELSAASEGLFTELPLESPDLPTVSFGTAMTIDRKAHLHGFGLVDEVEVAE